MKITPTAGPVIPAPVNTQPSAAQRAAKERVVAMLTGQGQQQAAPVSNPSQVSVEELGAIQTPRKAAPVAEEVELSQDEQLEPAAEVVEPAKDPLSSQYALLARKERALRLKVQQQEQSIRAKEAALQAKEDALKAKEQEYSTNYIPKNQIKQNALQALQDAGVSYDEVTQQQIDATNINPQIQSHIQRLEAQIKRLEASNEDQQKNQAKAQDEAYKAAVTQIRTDATKLVNSNPQEYEAIRATGSIKDVVELIEATFKAEGRVMDIEEAASEVEAYLVEQLDKLTELEKIKAKRAKVVATTPTVEQPAAKPSQPQTMRTLTNAAASTRTLSAKERAILAFKGELKG